jgi:hypothetical protein
MLFEMVKCLMIVLPCGHLMRQCVKLQVLGLKVELRSHQIVPISLICLWEFNLVYFVFNH